MEEASHSELQLAKELMAGHPDAFDRFVELYNAKVFRYSFTMCGQREDAEEVAQETLMKVFESLGQLRAPERLKPWVFRIAKNACLMKRRRSLFAPKRELSLDALKPSKSGDGEGARLEIADWSALPDDIASNGELKRALNRAVEQLPDIYKAVFLLRDVEELSTEDAAGVLGVSEDVVKTRLHRARLALRKSLDEHLRTAVEQVRER
ncbi:MAG TPA: sigma-70 family RNA polymerase sigma factor [Bryobacteraceae bacterium]|nr:sigma-70 family RNA polymerase sigma factor [Bryobacteraceae bacterium]